MKLRLFAPGLAIALLLVTVPLRAQTPAPMSLQQVLAVSRARNPGLLSAEQHVIATKASEITAGLRQNPTFTVSGANTTLPANNPSSPYT
ncbi:MAG: hypothetical protein WA399_00115, partial [Acidobacteriaceae bacterium]